MLSGLRSRDLLRLRFYAYSVYQSELLFSGWQTVCSHLSFVTVAIGDVHSLNWLLAVGSKIVTCILPLLVLGLFLE